MSPENFALLHDAKGIFGLCFHERGRDSVVSEKEQPAQGCSLDVFGGPPYPVGVEESEGLFGCFVAEWRAAVQPAIVQLQTFLVLAGLLVHNDVFTFAVIKKRGEVEVGFYGVCCHKELPLDGIRQNTPARGTGKNSIIGNQPKSCVLEEGKEELRFFCSFRSDQEHSLTVNICEHSPDGMDIEKPFRDIGHKAQGKAAERAIIVGIDKHSGFGLGIVIGARFAPWNIVHCVDNAVGFQVGFQLCRVPVFHPKVVEVRDIGPQLDDDTIYVCIPFEIICVAQMALHLGDKSVPHLDRNRRVHGRSFFGMCHRVVQGDAFDLFGRF